MRFIDYIMHGWKKVFQFSVFLVFKNQKPLKFKFLFLWFLKLSMKSALSQQPYCLDFLDFSHKSSSSIIINNNKYLIMLHF